MKKQAKKQDMGEIMEALRPKQLLNLAVSVWLCMHETFFTTTLWQAVKLQEMTPK